MNTFNTNTSISQTIKPGSIITPEFFEFKSGYSTAASEEKITISFYVDNCILWLYESEIYTWRSLSSPSFAAFAEIRQHSQRKKNILSTRVKTLRY